MSLQCIDGLGVPAVGAEISRNSAFFGFGEPELENAACDSDGIVRFPEKRFVCPLALGGLLIAVDYLNEIASLHGASLGGYSVVASKYGQIIWYVPGSELPASIRVSPRGQSLR